MQLKEKLAETLSKRSADVQGQYRKLVKDAADGKLNSPDQVLSVLERLGIDTAVFFADLDKAQQRNEWRELAAHVPELSRSLESVRAQKQAAADKFAATIARAREEFQAAAVRLDAEDNQLDARLTAAMRADGQLRAITDPALIQRRDQARAELANAESEIARLTNNLTCSATALPMHEKELAKVVAEAHLPGPNDSPALHAFYGQRLKDIERLKRMVADCKRLPAIIEPQIEAAKGRKAAAEGKLAEIDAEAFAL
jgi:hypothetical protein